MCPLISATLTPTTSIDAVFELFGFNRNAEHARVHRGVSSRSLLALFQAHAHASNILEVFGLLGFHADPKAESSQQYTGGLLLSAATVLTDGLGLSLVSYHKKSRAFIWAKKAHLYTWSGTSENGIILNILLSKQV